MSRASLDRVGVNVETMENRGRGNTNSSRWRKEGNLRSTRRQDRADIEAGIYSA